MQLAYVNKINYNIENYISGEKPEVVLVYMLNPFIPKIYLQNRELVTNDAKP